MDNMDEHILQAHRTYNPAIMHDYKSHWKGRARWARFRADMPDEVSLFGFRNTLEQLMPSCLVFAHLIDPDISLTH